MQENTNQHISKNIEQLLEENLKMKQLLRENNIEFEESSAYKEILENDQFQKARSLSKLAYWHYSYQSKKIESSIDAYRILEYSPSEELDAAKVLDRIHPDSRKNVISEISKKLEQENLFTIDTRLLASDGSIKYVSIKFIVERDDSQAIFSLSGTITDNTENHFLIDRLRGNEELFRSLFNNLTDIFIIFEIIKDNDNNIIDYIYKDVNPTFEMKFGMSKADVINKKLSSRPSFFQQLNPLFQLSIIAGQPQQDRIFFQSLDSFFDILIYSPSEKTMATIWRDVTLMVEAESSLRESEEKYRQIFSIGSDALFMFDYNSGRILDVNPTACKLFGYPKETMLKMQFKQLSTTPDILEQQINNQTSLLQNFFSVKSNNVEFPIEISLSYFNWSGRKVSIASVRDISERIVAQDKLIKSEQKFKQLFDYSNDAILIIKNYRIIDFNQKSLSLFDKSREELVNKTLWNLSPSKQSSEEESRNKAVEFIQNSLLGNQLQFEWIFQHPSRNTFIADIKLSPIVVGNEKLVQAIVRDISPQKKSQNALVMKEELWKSSLAISSIGVWEWNIITNDVYFSTVWKNILGFEKNELPNNIEELYSRIHTDDLIPFKKIFNDFLLAKSDLFSVDLKMRCKNGTFKWIRSQGKIYSYNDEGKPEKFIGTHIDITKQKIIEEKLNQEIHDLSFSHSISQIGYWILDLKTLVITGPRNTFSILGFNDSELLTLRQIEKIIHPEDQQNFISQFISHTNQSSLENVFRVLVNNSTRYIISRSRPIKNSKNILTGFRGTFQDITFLKQDNADLNDEIIFFKSIFNNLQCSILISKEKTTLFTNTKITDLTGYSYKDILAKNISPLSITIEEDRNQLKKVIDSVLSNPTHTEKTEIRIETKNNRTKWVEITVSSIETKDGSAILFLLFDISSRKNNEHELLTSVKQLKSISTNSRSAIALVDNDGHFVYTNESFYLLSGLNHSEKSLSYESLFNEKDLVIVSKGMETLSLSISQDFTFDFYQFGTNKIWVRLNIVPIKDDKNEIEYFVFYFTNIDADKKKMMKLEEENETAQTLKDFSPIGFAILNNKQEIINYNLLFANEVKLQTKSKIFLSDIDKFSAHQSQISRFVIGEQVPYSFEISPSPDQYLQVKIIPITLQNKMMMLIFTSDITSSKATTDSLSIELERYRGLFDNAPLGISLIDKNRNIIISNPKFEKYLGYRTNELNFVKIDSLIDTQNLGEFISKFSQLFTGIANSFQQVLKMNAKTGENLWINANTSSIKDNYGDSKYSIFFIEDISQLKNEEQGALANERLQTLHYIANSFAHQFNNLLMGIYGNSYLLNNYLKDTNLSRYTSELLSSSNRASELTHKLLSFSEKTNTINILINSGDLLSDIINSITPNNKIRFKKVLNNKNELLIGDPSQLKRAILYIIENALESMCNGGELTIETTIAYFEPEGSNHKLKLEKGKYLRIAISDTGNGITTTEINKIFDPFYTTKPDGLSSGLGLSITKQIINSHNGFVKVSSSNDKGTCFNIYLPIKESNKYFAAIQPDEQLIHKGSVKILLVDDEEVVRLITSELLSELGYDVYSFASGKKAIKFYKDNSSTIDLALLDKFMPEMDGVEVYKNLRAINPTVKAVILTGFNIDEELESLIAESLCGYIQKPVSIEKLSSSLSGILFNKS
jgi:PAS domain S-box-containing protein